MEYWNDTKWVVLLRLKPADNAAFSSSTENDKRDDKSIGVFRSKVQIYSDFRSLTRMHWAMSTTVNNCRE